MLLRHTSGQLTERMALTVNPAKTCQPVGAMYAALGIHNCLPHSHGSQGCCAYHRSALTRHYKDPVMATTSSFTEGASVFGGQANLVEAINNVFTIYNPDIIAVHTTCLSEVIGDDRSCLWKVKITSNITFRMQPEWHSAVTCIAGHRRSSGKKGLCAWFADWALVPWTA